MVSLLKTAFILYSLIPIICDSSNMKKNICSPFVFVKEPANSRSQEAPTASVNGRKQKIREFKGKLLSWIKATDGKEKIFE